MTQNTNIKSISTKTMKNKELLFLLASLFCVIWIYFDKEVALNFTFAFFAFLSIVFSVFTAQKKKIDSLLKSKQENHEVEEQDSNPNPKTQKISRYKFFSNFNTTDAKIGMQLFFLRLLCYGILIVGILIFIHKEIFNLWAFFSGLFCANLFAVFVAFFRINPMNAHKESTTKP